jgi:cytochrome P450
MTKESIGGAEDFHSHKMRRDALNPFFSQKAVMNLEPLLRSKSDQMATLLDRAAASDS